MYTFFWHPCFLLQITVSQLGFMLFSANSALHTTGAQQICDHQDRVGSEAVGRTKLTAEPRGTAPTSCNCAWTGPLLQAAMCQACPGPGRHYAALLGFTTEERPNKPVNRPLQTVSGLSTEMEQLGEQSRRLTSQGDRRGLAEEVPSGHSPSTPRPRKSVPTN